MEWSQVKFEYERARSCLLRQDRKAPHKGHEFLYVHAPQKSKLQSPLSHLRWLDLYEGYQAQLWIIYWKPRHMTHERKHRKVLSDTCTNISMAAWRMKIGITTNSLDSRYLCEAQKNTLSDKKFTSFLLFKILLSLSNPPNTSQYTKLHKTFPFPLH